MAHSDYIRFLVATQSDSALKAALRRSSSGLRTLGELVAFAERHGFCFAEEDVPLEAAQALWLPPGTGAAVSRRPAQHAR